MDEFNENGEFKNKTPLPKTEKPKKRKYIVQNVTPSWVTLEENGNGFRVENIWKDLKIGDEILI